MEENREVKPVRRRRHSAAFKAEAVKACMHPGVSIAAVALHYHYRLNANLLRRWVADHETQQPDAVIPADKPMPIEPAEFIPLQLNLPDTAANTPVIVIDVGRRSHGEGALASVGCSRMRNLAAKVTAVIRIDAVWLAVAPLDMRTGMDTALARVITVFGSAQTHHAYLFAIRQANCIKVLNPRWHRYPDCLAPTVPGPLRRAHALSR